jgi:DNA-binding CsgD family transcriptional regulator
MTHLLGRRATLDRLVAGARATAAGRPVVVMVRDQTGPGTSSLTDALRAEVGAAMTVLRLGVETDGPADDDGLDSVRRRLAAAGAPAAHLLHVPAGYQAFHDLVSAVHQLAARRPVLVAVDDAERAGETVLRWLEFLLRRSDALALMVLLAVAPDTGPATNDALTDLLAAVRYVPIDLLPLSVADVEIAIVDALGTGPTDGFAAAVDGVCGGSPLLVGHLLATARDRRIEPDEAGRAWIAHAGRRTLVDPINRLLDSRPPSIRAVAEAMAVLPGGDVDLLVAMTGLAERTVAGAVGALRRLHVADPEGNLSSAARAAVVDDRTDADRDALYRRAARVLNISGQPPDRVAAPICRIRGPLDQWMPDLLTEACEQAIRRGDRETADRCEARLIGGPTVPYELPATGPPTALPPAIATAVRLFFREDLRGAQRAVHRLVDLGGEPGAAPVTVLALAAESLLYECTGDIRTGLSAARVAYEIDRCRPAGSPSTLARAVFARMLLRAGDVATAADVLETIRPPDPLERPREHQLVLMVSAHLLRRTGRADEALVHLHRAAAGVTDDADLLLIPWWLEVAEACAVIGRPSDGAALIGPAVRAVARQPSARARGLALLAEGLITPGPPGLERLHRAVDALTGTAAEGDLVRARFALGRALLADGDDRAARQHLRTVVACAVRGGEHALAADARILLVAASGRMTTVPRRPIDLLTGGEMRVVDLVRDGRSNQEIAETLYISRRTVEAHLTSAYRKVGVRGRAELVGRLADVVTVEPA